MGTAAEAAGVCHLVSHLLGAVLLLLGGAEDRAAIQSPAHPGQGQRDWAILAGTQSDLSHILLHAAVIRACACQCMCQYLVQNIGILFVAALCLHMLEF